MNDSESKKLGSSCYDFAEHPEGIEPLRDSLLSLDIEQIGESLTKIIRGLRQKTEPMVIEELRDCSKRFAGAIDTASIFAEQLRYHRIEFKGYLFFLERQMSSNITKSMRVISSLRERGFSSLTPIAKLIIGDLSQVRKIVLAKNLAQLEELLTNPRTLLARNRHKTRM